MSDENLAWVRERAVGFASIRQAEGPLPWHNGAAAPVKSMAYVEETPAAYRLRFNEEPPADLWEQVRTVIDWSAIA